MYARMNTAFVKPGQLDEFIAIFEESQQAAHDHADAYADVEGLVWKAWTINEEAQHAGAVYLFESADARSAYLAATVASHPALSDFRVQEYAIMAAESLVTSAPVGAEIMNDAEGIGTMLQVSFSYNVPTEVYIAEVSPLAEQFAAAAGLRWKIWALDEKTANSAASSSLTHWAMSRPLSRVNWPRR